MMQIPRSELCLHTVMSENISVVTPEAAIRAAVEKGLKALAVTDLNSVQSFHSLALCRERYGKDLKVIYGAELSDGTVCLVKDQAGLKALYRLLSGKTLLPGERAHLLLGAGENSALHRSAREGADDERLRELASSYDYIALGVRNDRPRHQTMNRRLYALGKALGKPVVAVSGCRYLTPEDRIGLVVLEEVKCWCSNPLESHLRSTRELLSHYASLGEEGAYETVVTNPNLLADSIGFVDPLVSSIPRFSLPEAEDRVRQICQARLETLYAREPRVWQRLEQELSLLNENASMFLLLHQLVRHMQEQRSLTGFRGTVGSTLIAWLLDISDMNPLPAHYRCPHCRYTEFVPADSGFDLPKKRCPHCAGSMVGDGHNIPFETCLGPEGTVNVDIDLNIGTEERPEAIRFLAELLGQDRLASAGTVDTHFPTARAYWQVYEDMTGQQLSGKDRERAETLISRVKRGEGIHPGGIMLLPEGIHWEDVTPLREDDGPLPYATGLTCFDIHPCLPKLDILPVDIYDRLRELFARTGVTPADIDYRDEAVYTLLREGGTDGIPEFSDPLSRELLKKQDKLCFSDLIRICGLSHSTNGWLENGALFAERQPFRELISTRDDVFLRLVSFGLDRRTAFDAMTATRKGRFHREEALAEQLRQAGVPDWYIDSMKAVRYLFPKAHAAHYGKLGYMTAWFQVHYPEQFRSVIREKEISPG